MKYKIRIADILTAYDLGLTNKEQTESKLFDLLVVGKSLPNDDDVFDKAANYIKRTGIINKPTLEDEVFRAYKYGCFWMRRQLK